MFHLNNAVGITSHSWQLASSYCWFIYIYIYGFIYLKIPLSGFVAAYWGISYCIQYTKTPSLKFNVEPQTWALGIDFPLGHNTFKGPPWKKNLVCPPVISRYGNGAFVDTLLAKTMGFSSCFLWKQPRCAKPQSPTARIKRTARSPQVPPRQPGSSCSLTRKTVVFLEIMVDHGSSGDE